MKLRLQFNTNTIQSFGYPLLTSLLELFDPRDPIPETPTDTFGIYRHTIVRRRYLSYLPQTEYSSFHLDLRYCVVCLHYSKDKR